MHHKFQEITSALHILYSEEESISSAFILFTDLLGIKKTDIFITGKQALTSDQEEILNAALTRLLNHEPIQHIIGWTMFMGCKIICNPDVMIPRPETEELVQLLLKEIKSPNPVILDIGTGSGCIAIAIKKQIPGATVFGLDISEKALNIAKKNAKENEAEIKFYLDDILNPSENLFQSEFFDYIISNPPYVLESQKKQMKSNVLDFEPKDALFAPDDDPLVYYKANADFGINYLKRDGKLFVEINEMLGDETLKLFKLKGYSNSKLLKDLYKKNRFVISTFNRY